VCVHVYEERFKMECYYSTVREKVCNNREMSNNNVRVSNRPTSRKRIRIHPFCSTKKVFHVSLWRPIRQRMQERHRDIFHIKSVWNLIVPDLYRYFTSADENERPRYDNLRCRITTTCFFLEALKIALKRHMKTLIFVSRRNDRLYSYGPNFNSNPARGCVLHSHF
jgi:hypothetical protein